VNHVQIYETYARTKQEQSNGTLANVWCVLPVAVPDRNSKCSLLQRWHALSFFAAYGPSSCTCSTALQLRETFQNQSLPNINLLQLTTGLSQAGHKQLAKSFHLL